MVQMWTCAFKFQKNPTFNAAWSREAAVIVSMMILKVRWSCTVSCCSLFSICHVFASLQPDSAPQCSPVIQSHVTFQLDSAWVMTGEILCVLRSGLRLVDCMLAHYDAPCVVFKCCDLVHMPQHKSAWALICSGVLFIIDLDEDCISDLIG